MKFVHAADIHLGACPDAGRLLTPKREKEIWSSFEKLLQVCEREHVDLLLVAGDLFHRQPLLRELKEVNYLFSKLSVTQVVMIVGNHDYLKKDSYYHTFGWAKNVHVILGFASEKDAFYLDEFKSLGVDVNVCTNDGSLGTKGFVTDVMKDKGLCDAFYMACGPMPMLKAIYTTSNSKGLLSFEERMGCGFGACMGCSCKTITGYKRICVEGPVMESEDILWKD